MKRLADGEKAHNQSLVLRLLRRFGLGVKESELAQELGWERRTVNNYLRALRAQDKAYRDGRFWLADDDT